MVAARRAATPGARGVAVLGDMLELGPDAARMHYEIGTYAAQHGIEVLALGCNAGDTVAGARAAGGVAQVAATAQVPALLRAKAGDVVVLKASRGLGLPVDELDRRGLGLERLVAAITDAAGLGGPR
jgi:UDP-N-acetylmuramoyl-tripeptide--D-alanyl-D-alanine ligase